MSAYSRDLLELAAITPVAIPEGAAVTERANRLCGDKVAVSPDIRDGVIAELRWRSEGCAILKAGAAYLAELIRGKDIRSALDAIAAYKSSFAPGEKPASGPMAAAHSLPARYKCALLAFEACEDFLRQCV